MELSSSSPAQLLRSNPCFKILLPRLTSIASSSPRFLRMDSQSHRPQSISCASPLPDDNGFPAIATSSPIVSGSKGEVKRETKETNVSVKINLDGNGVAVSSTGIPFLDHMLDIPAAAAVARALAGLLSDHRLSTSSTATELSSIYGNRPLPRQVEELEDGLYEEDFDPVRHILENVPDDQT